MTQNLKRILFFIFLFFFSINIIAQEVFEINLSITDTVIIRKKVKKNYKYAIKVAVEINVQNVQDSLFLYSFRKYVTSLYFINDFSPDTYKNYSTGLLYVIEDENNHIIPPPFPSHSSGITLKHLKKRMNERRFVTSKLKIKHKLLNEQEKQDYDFPKYVITNENQSLELFPLFGEYHYDLPKGDYFFYFVYSWLPPTNAWDNTLPIDDRAFRGYFVSNRVKLIVE